MHDIGRVTPPICRHGRKKGDDPQCRKLEIIPHGIPLIHRATTQPDLLSMMGLCGCPPMRSLMWINPSLDMDQCITPPGAA
jgi:hypothetical protein